MKLEAGSLPYLSDHQVRGTVVLPAAVYLSMALAAGETVAGGAPLVLRDVAFRNAFVVPAAGARALQLAVSSQFPGAWSFRFSSPGSDGAAQSTEWMVHATGTIVVDSGPSAPHDAPASVRSRRPDECRRGVSRLSRGASNTDRASAAWDISHGQDRASRVPAGVVPARGQDRGLHPCMLDAGLQGLAAPLPGRETWVPSSIGRFVAGRVGDMEAWCHTRRRRDEPGDTTDELTGDVLAFDRDGRLLVEAHGVRFAKLQRANEETPADWLYEVRWEPASRGPSRPHERQSGGRGSWLILGDGRGLGKALAAALIARGEPAVVNEPAVDVERSGGLDALLARVFANGGPTPRGVVHLGALDTPDTDALTAASLDVAQEQGCITALRLVQALVRTAGAAMPRLWLVTRGLRRSAKPGGRPRLPCGDSGRCGDGAPRADVHCVDLAVDGHGRIPSLVDGLLADGSRIACACVRATIRGAARRRAAGPDSRAGLGPQA
jgi:acyl transferase domain-containing protein